VKLDAPLLLVGCGKMGGALLDGWLKQGVNANQVTVVEPAPVKAPAGVRVVASADALPADFRPGLVVIAVKPQSMGDVLPAYRRFSPGAAFVSIAAGKTISAYTSALGDKTAVVRVMPNTPAAIGQGMSVLCANANASAATRALAAELMHRLGTDRVDLVLLHEASPLLAHRVIRDGRARYVRDEQALHAFQFHAIQRYLDTKRLRNSLAEALAARLQAGGFGRRP